VKALEQMTNDQLVLVCLSAANELHKAIRDRGHITVGVAEFLALVAEVAEENWTNRQWQKMTN
jgi:hypothetical protein